MPLASYDARIWLREVPPGSAEWLKPIARAALHHERNDIRLMGENVLRAAGEMDAKAELRPPALYRLFVNGELWRTEPRLGGRRAVQLKVKQAPGGSQNALVTNGYSNQQEGVIHVASDDFAPSARVVSATLCASPSFQDDESALPAEPWIHAKIPNPPAFGKTTDLPVETVEVTIRPRYPRPVKNYDGAISEVGFGWAEKGVQPADTACIYHLTGRGPLVLAQVQPGEYWLRVRAPGAALGQWEKIAITKSKTRFEPRLDIGASGSVPLRWPETLTVEEFDPVIVLYQHNWWGGVPALFEVKRNGKNFSRAAPGPGEHVTDLFKDPLSLGNLPVGKYRVRLRSSLEVRAAFNYLPKPDHPYADWEAVEVSFEVNGRSPSEFTAAPLKIEPAS